MHGIRVWAEDNADYSDLWPGKHVKKTGTKKSTRIRLN